MSFDKPTDMNDWFQYGRQLIYLETTGSPVSIDKPTAFRMIDFSIVV